MVVKPQADGSTVEISRGPNIGAPPSNTECPEDLNGIVTLKVGDKITTDHIMPAGNRLKYRSNIPAYAQFVFEREAPEFATRAAKFRDDGLGTVIVAGESYGQGSSREHAAICPMYLGVKMVVAKSIERIHRANLINFGIIPALFENQSDYDLIQKDKKVTCKDMRSALKQGNSITLDVEGTAVKVRVELSDRERAMILAGGLINVTRQSA
jgi:aconitate hydratase